MGDTTRMKVTLRNGLITFKKHSIYLRGNSKYGGARQGETKQDKARKISTQ